MPPLYWYDALRSSVTYSSDLTLNILRGENYSKFTAFDTAFNSYSAPGWMRCIVVSVSVCLRVGLGLLKLQEWTLQEWTMREDGAGVDTAVVSRRDAVSEENHFTARRSYRDHPTQAWAVRDARRILHSRACASSSYGQTVTQSVATHWGQRQRKQRRRGLDVGDDSDIWREHELHRLGWVTVSGFDSRRRHFISVCNQPPRSTQPSTLRGTVKWVPAKGRWCSAAGE